MRDILSQKARRYGMETTTRPTIFLSNKFQVTVTWVWNFVGNFMILAFAMLFLSANININRQAIQADPRLMLIPVVAELVAAGMLPVLFTIYQRESPAIYGFQKQGLRNGILLSLLIIILYAILVYLGIERFTPIHIASLRTGSIWQPGCAFMAAFAYGPLEVFFVIWLIHNTDRIFHSENNILSRGLVVTILIYGVLHAFSQGFFAILLAARYFSFGWIYKVTHNSIGPMVAGTVTNEFIWFLAGVLLQAG
jgi:hypothetical protein